MTVSTNFYPQESFPPLFDLSALFGFRSKSKPAWRYEPPRPCAETKPLATCTSELRIGKPNISSVVSTPSPDFVPPHSLEVGHAVSSQQEWRTHDTSEKHATVSEAGGSAVDSCEAACFTGYKPAFEAFQARVAEAHGLKQQEQDKILRAAFQECCPASDVSIYVTRVLRHVLHLGLNPKAILSHQSTSDYTVPFIHTEESLDLLACLERFMHQYPHCVSDIHRIHIRLAILAKTIGPSNVYQEKRMLKLMQQLWLSAQLAGIGVTRSTRLLLRSLAYNCNDQFYKATLTTIFSDIVLLQTSLFKLVVGVRDQIDLMAPAIDIMSCIPQEILLQNIQKVTKDLAKEAREGVGRRKLEHLKILHVWLQLLHQLDDNKIQTQRTLVDTAFTTIVKDVFYSRKSDERWPLLLFTCLIVASQKNAYKDIPLAKISDTLEACYAVFEQNGLVSFQVASGVVMSRMIAKGLPPQLAVQMITDTLTQYDSLDTVRDFLNVLERRSLALFDSTLVCSRISRQMASRQQSTNSSLHADAVLHTCQQIARKLSSICTLPGDLEAKLEKMVAERRFKAILRGAEELKLLPSKYCNLDAAIPVKERGVLVHQLAHQYTTSTVLTQMEVWRAIYRLYRYLQQESLPIGPLFSKAVVWASIIRPLSENRFVSARRLIWVCHLVTKVEGEDVAKKVEADFWQWRGGLIQHAKGVHVRIGGSRQDKAHLGTMSKLGLI